MYFVDQQQVKPSGVVGGGGPQAVFLGEGHTSLLPYISVRADNGCMRNLIRVARHRYCMLLDGISAAEYDIDLTAPISGPVPRR